MSGDTIFALATPAGRSGVAVFRISGPRAGEVLKTLTNRALPAPRIAAKRRFYQSPETAIDDGLAIHFPAPNSFTGEDVVELHTHLDQVADLVRGLLHNHFDHRFITKSVAGD